MNKLLKIAAFAMLAACSMDTRGTGENEAPKGSITMPLTKTVDGISFYIDGTVTIVSTPDNVTVATVDIGTPDAEIEIVQVPVGNYNVVLSNWTTFYMKNGQSVDVTGLSQLLSPASVAVTVTENATATVSYDFIINGFVLNFDVCATINLSCPTQDQDDDGVANGVECPSGALNAPDTDGDGTIDCLDLDSDNDCIPDESELTNAARLDDDLPADNLLVYPDCVLSVPQDAGVDASSDGGSISIGTNICIGNDAGVCASDAGTDAAL